VTPEQHTGTVACIGFGEREGTCEHDAGGPPRDNPIWCGECDTARIEHISSQLERIAATFRDSEEKT
jgi:hypothetical protein